MMNSRNAWQKLLAIVPQLNDWQTFMVLKFIGILQSFPSFSRQHSAIQKVESFDPLEKFIGAVENGKLAQNIDQDLYE